MTEPRVGLDIPAAVDRRLLVSYGDYAGAQRTVDELSDKGFPVQHVAIVGNDLRLEETVTGRLTNARAALTGAGSGAVFGFVVGLFLGLFTSTTGSFVALVLWAALWGAILGAAFGFINHAFQGGRRDFASRSALVAGRYDVMVATVHLDHARTILDGTTGGGGAADTVVVDPPPSAGLYSERTTVRDTGRDAGHDTGHDAGHDKGHGAGHYGEHDTTPANPEPTRVPGPRAAESPTTPAPMTEPRVSEPEPPLREDAERSAHRSGSTRRPG